MSSIDQGVGRELVTPEHPQIEWRVPAAVDRPYSSPAVRAEIDPPSHEHPLHIAHVVCELFFWALVGLVVLAMLNTAAGR